jgi:putative component of toxin-antitoxin plasmid stabilization module
MAVKARFHYWHDKLGYRNSNSLIQKKIDRIQLAEVPSEKKTISEAIFSVLQIGDKPTLEEKERKDLAHRFEK